MNECVSLGSAIIYWDNTACWNNLSLYESIHLISLPGITFTNENRNVALTMWYKDRLFKLQQLFNVS